MADLTQAEQAAADAKALVSGLTKRQRDVLVLTCKGLSTKEIGAGLFISHKTVEAHRQAIYAQFEVHTTAEAAVIAAKAGIV